jgi:hypothetical protein
MVRSVAEQEDMGMKVGMDTSKFNWLLGLFIWYQLISPNGEMEDEWFPIKEGERITLSGNWIMISPHTFQRRDNGYTEVYTIVDLTENRIVN